MMERNEEFDKELISLLNSGQKIKAVKRCVDLYKIGLKEASIHIDSLITGYIPSDSKSSSDNITQLCLEFGYSPFSTKTEFKMLPSLIANDEKLLGVIEGVLKDICKTKFNGYGILAVTDRRVIFYRKNFIGIETKEEIPLSRISSASSRNGMMFSSIVVTSSNNDALIDSCDKKQADKVVKVILDAIHNYNKPTQTVTTPPVDIASQLEKLFDLKQKGILTEDEFTQQKAKVLNI